MKNEDEIFKETEEEFQKLKYLFKNNWINLLDQSAIKVLKFMDIYKIQNELALLRNYFGLPQIFVFDNLLEEIKYFRQNYNIQFNEDSNLNEEINNLKDQLNFKDQIIEQNKLTINNNQTLIKKLENDIYIKEQELISVKNKLIQRTEELNNIKLCNKDDNNYVIKRIMKVKIMKELILLYYLDQLTKKYFFPFHVNLMI